MGVSGTGDSLLDYGLRLLSAELLGSDSFPHRRMKTATYASARTANAARNSLNAGLRIAFRSGAVMGLVVVGLGLLDISFWYLLLNAVIPVDVMTPTHKLCIITTTMLTFGMGASTQALFARVGGGIYTKAADVGADLVGKVEAGIPETIPAIPQPLPIM